MPEAEEAEPLDRLAAERHRSCGRTLPEVDADEVEKIQKRLALRFAIEGVRNHRLEELHRLLVVAEVFEKPRCLKLAPAPRDR